MRRGADVVAHSRRRKRAVGGLQTVLGAGKYRRRGLGASEATGGARYYRLLRRAADVVAGPRSRERAVGGLQAVLGATKHRRRNVGAREATGGTWECRILRRAADVVAGPWCSGTIYGSSKVLGRCMRDKRAATRTVVFNVSQNPPSGQLGPWGAKKEQKDSHNERS